MLANLDEGLIRLALKRNLLLREVAERLLAEVERSEVSAAHLLETRAHLDPAVIDELLETQRRQSIPVRFDGYRIAGLLGRGGTAVVLRGERESDGLAVAIKLISPRVESQPTAAARFQRETRSAVKVEHPHVVRCFGAGTVNGRPYLVLELMDGGDVRALLRNARGPLPERRALSIALHCCRGLGEIARQGMMHRDLKPANIFLDRFGNAKIADLGLAKSRDLADQLTLVGMCVGTPIYMSPEQVAGRPDVDIRTDIYALGATLYHMATGVMPFGGPTPEAIMRDVALVEPKAATVVNPRLNPAIEAVIVKAMAKDRRRRYQTPEQFATDLEAILAGRQPAATAVILAEDGHAAPLRRAWWRRWLRLG